MKAVLLKVTARRTKKGLETIKREVVGECREGADRLLDRLAEILAETLIKNVKAGW
ncbi:MAG: hypothetical protein K6U74_14055 [Firmicutes bacterium]|nr:hypothetical protein [Bacillota bacterium]